MVCFERFCTCVFILSSTAKVNSEHRPINVISQPAIELGTLRFQNNHEVQYATDAITDTVLSPEHFLTHVHHHIVRFRQRDSVGSKM